MHLTFFVEPSKSQGTNSTMWRLGETILLWHINRLASEYRHALHMRRADFTSQQHSIRSVRLDWLFWHKRYLFCRLYRFAKNQFHLNVSVGVYDLREAFQFISLLYWRRPIARTPTWTLAPAPFFVCVCVCHSVGKFACKICVQNSSGYIC